jgi:hypothetical protein
MESATLNESMKGSAIWRCAAIITILSLAVPVSSQLNMRESTAKPVEDLTYSIEWRLVRAGTARLTRTPETNSGWRSDLSLVSAGLVSKLYKVKDSYSVHYDSAFCAASTYMLAEEGSRRRETNVTFHRDTKKSVYLEKDMVKNTIALQKELDIPPCVHDVIAALNHLRALKTPVGQSIVLPMSDGKRMVQAKIDVQEKENVKTQAGTFSAIRYEAHLFNDVLYQRKGRLFVWISDDDSRLLVQVRARLNFPVGTITFQLEKIGTP